MNLIFKFLDTFLILVPYNHRKLNNIPQLGLGDSKMSLDIGNYLHIHILEYLFDIPILRYFFIFEVFPGSYPLFRGIKRVTVGGNFPKKNFYHINPI